MSNMEMIAKIKKAWDALDADKNNQIDRSELEKLIKALVPGIREDPECDQKITETYQICFAENFFDHNRIHLVTIRSFGYQELCFGGLVGFSVLEIDCYFIQKYLHTSLLHLHVHNGFRTWYLRLYSCNCFSRFFLSQLAILIVDNIYLSILRRRHSSDRLKSNFQGTTTQRSERLDKNLKSLCSSQKFA